MDAVKQFLKDFVEDPFEYAGQAIAVLAAVAAVIGFAVYFFKGMFQ